MAIKSNITDPSTGDQVKVVAGNALAVAPPAPSKAFNATLGANDTPVNIVPAKADSTFYITGILLTGNQQVSNTVNATVNIYVADAADTALSSALETVLTISVGRGDSRDITGILVDTQEGKWVNGETTDDDVIVTILGYYV